MTTIVSGLGVNDESTIIGSSGLIGSALVFLFDRRPQVVIGVDNNMRAVFFGHGGDTRWNLQRPADRDTSFLPSSVGHSRSARTCVSFPADGPFDLIIHCAAQPSHDLAPVSTGGPSADSTLRDRPVTFSRSERKMACSLSSTMTWTVWITGWHSLSL